MLFYFHKNALILNVFEKVVEIQFMQSRSPVLTVWRINFSQIIENLALASSLPEVGILIFEINFKSREW